MQLMDGMDGTYGCLTKALGLICEEKSRLVGKSTSLRPKQPAVIIGARCGIHEFFYLVVAVLYNK
jgi:hypothetical protein